MELVAIILQGKICKVGELGKLAPAPSILQKSTKGSRLSAQLFSDCRLFFVDCGFGDNPRVGPQTIFNPKKSSADNSIGVCWENRTTLPRTHKVIIPLSCLGLFFNKLTPAPGPLSLLGSFELRSSVVSVLPRVTPGTPPSWRVYVLTWFLEQGVKPGFIQLTPRVPSVLQYLWACAHFHTHICVYITFNWIILLPTTPLNRTQKRNENAKNLCVMEEARKMELHYFSCMIFSSLLIYATFNGNQRIPRVRGNMAYFSLFSWYFLCEICIISSVNKQEKVRK